jgi:hypothetical protein
MAITNEERCKVITHLISKKFRCFGKGSVVPPFCESPITEAMKDKPLQFAAGVDVAEVVNFVIEYADALQ